MPNLLPEQKRFNAQFADWVVMEILKAKARWLHIVYTQIVPPAIYKKAANQEGLKELARWLAESGFALREMQEKDGGLMADGAAGETQITKGPILVGVFRPRIVGEKEEKHLEFLAVVNGVQVDVADPELTCIPPARQ